MLRSLLGLALVGSILVGCAPTGNPNELMGSAESSDDEDTGAAMSVEEWQAEANATGNELTDALAEPKAGSAMPGQGFIKGASKAVGNLSIVGVGKIAATVAKNNLTQFGSFKTGLGNPLQQMQNLPAGAKGSLAGLIGDGSGLLSTLQSKTLDANQRAQLVNTLLTYGHQQALHPDVALQPALAAEAQNLAKGYGGSAADYFVFVPADFNGVVTLKSRQFVKLVGGQRRLVGFSYTLDGVDHWVGMGG